MVLEPTGGEVYIVLVVAALQRVERPVHLAGKFLTAVHTLPLEVVTQVGNVILIPGREVKKINYSHLI